MTTQRLILGTVLAGDLRAYEIAGPRGLLGRRAYLGLTWDALTHHVVLLGATGTGKTVTLMRLAAAAFAMKTDDGGPPPAVYYLDAKGIPGDNRSTFLALARDAGATRIIDWPTDQVNGFTGSRADLRERIAGLWDAEESPFHHAEAVSLLELALSAEPMPNTLAGLTSRTRPGMTATVLEHMGTAAAMEMKSRAERFTATQWNGLHLRLAALHATVGQSLDGGEGSTRLCDADAAWVSIPGTRSPQAAADLTSWFLGLISDLATQSNPRRTLVILDEFSAIGADKRASSAAAGLVERIRSSGVAFVVSSQTTDALGVHASRLLRTAGTVISHRTPGPEDIVALAGATTEWEDTHVLGAMGIRHAITGRAQQQYRVPPDLVRSLRTGEAVVVHAGRWAHVVVPPTAESGIRRPSNKHRSVTSVR